jgi:phage FluMu protein Com
MNKLLKEKRNKEWRCPRCQRLLAIENEDGFLEIKTKNRQVVRFKPLVVKVLCKCGLFTEIRQGLDKGF